MSALEHIPLDRSTRQIRLLSFVEVDAVTALIHCRLETYDLDHCPSFVALSYKWGDLHLSRAIILNGKPFLLGQNLHSALSFLGEDALCKRSSWRNLYWIDAICINQQDDLERSHQVNMMGTIYSKARFVLVWLGPGTVDSERALEEAAAYCELPWEHQRENNLTQSIRRSGIATNAYWERMWVIQEFTLARDIFLLQGHSRLRWKKLEPKLTEIGIVGCAMQRLADVRIRRGETPFSTASETTSWTRLEFLISMFQSSKCSDVRDRVYALLSLVQTRPEDWKPLYPDYTISPRQLYYRVLGGLRHSPSFRISTNWDSFRDHLRRFLVLPRDETFEKNDFLYRASEPERPGQKPLMSLHPDHRTGLGFALLKDVADYLHWPLAHMERDPQRIYKDVIQMFQPFPKEEDPEAWNCFDKLLKQALGLWSTTGEDSEMWNTFVDFPGMKLLSQGSRLC